MITPYVYEWIREDTGEPFYVGKGTGDRYKRVAPGKRNKEFMAIYNSVPTYPYILTGNLDEEVACKMEMHMISEYKDMGIRLTNHTKGGEKGGRFIATEDYRRNMSIRNTGSNNPNYGNHWSKEQREAASKRIRETGCHLGGKNPKARTVQCVETGEIFSNMEEAAASLGLKSGGSIIVALKNPNRTAHGYHWISLGRTCKFNNGRITQ